MGNVDEWAALHALRAQWEVEGRCVSCGGERVEGRQFCELHLLKQRINKQGKREAQRALGLCTECDEAPVQGKNLCAGHVAQQAARNARQQAIIFGHGDRRPCSACKLARKRGFPWCEPHRLRRIVIRRRERAAAKAARSKLRCRRCGKRFAVRQGSPVYCSKPCRRLADISRNRRRRVSARPTCAICKARRVSKGASKYCSDGCRYQAKKAQLYAKRAPVGSPRVIACKECGTEFAVAPRSSGRRYCSLRCRHAQQRAIYALERAEKKRTA